MNEATQSPDRMDGATLDAAQPHGLSSIHDDEMNEDTVRQGGTYAEDRGSDERLKNALLPLVLATVLIVGFILLMTKGG